MSDEVIDSILSERFDRALTFATAKHAPQPRKGTQIPYIAHLLAVCSLVLEDGGSEDEAIAALLHDAPEDSGGRKTLAEIDERFGPEVAAIVDGCTDTYEDPKPPWRRRNQDYIAHMREAPPEVLRVSLADKLHNARSILYDHRVHGEDLWDRFGGRREGTLWYYGELSRAFSELHPGPMAGELARTVKQLPRGGRG